MNENSMKISNFELKIIVYRIISSKIIFFLIVTFCILSLNLTPLIAHIRHSPPGRTFALIHNNAQDFFFYQALMNEGANGAWLTTNPYTTEPHQPSLIFAYFLWLGKVSQFIGLPFAVMYHLTRLILSILFLFIAFSFINVLKISRPRLTFLFFLFAAPFLHTIVDYGKERVVPYMYWWTAMDPVRRVAYLPHHMAGGILLIATMFLFIQFIETGKYKYIFSNTVIAALLAFIHPPSLMIVLLSVPSAFVLYNALQLIFVKDKHKKKTEILTLVRKLSAGFFLYIVIAIGSIILTIAPTQNDIIWQTPFNWEKTQQLPIASEIIGAFGILAPLTIIGVVYAFKQKSFSTILIACWFGIPLLLIPFAPKLGIANVRLIQGLPYFTLAILASMGLKALQLIFANSKFPIFQPKADPPLVDISQFSMNFQLGNFQIKNLDLIKNLKLKIQNYLIPTIVFIIFIYFSYPTISWSLQDQIREYWPIFGNAYFDNRLSQAFSFINENYPKNTIVVATFYTSNYLPAFTHIRSVIGHFGYTYNMQDKDEKVMKFFKGQMSPDDAKNFLLGNKVDLVFQGPEEKPIYSNYLYPAILKPVYDKEEATIYVLR